MLSITKVVHNPFYRKLGQNIFRHDGLLAMARGTVLKIEEVEELKYRGIDMIMTYDNDSKIGARGDYAFMLSVIEEAYKKTTIWENSFGERAFETIRAGMLQYKKLFDYLDELRVVDSKAFVHMINVSIVVMSLLKEGTDADELLIFKLGLISLVHDVGRLKMVDVFLKKGKLDNYEFAKLKTHPLESLKMLKKAGLDENDIGFIVETHEKFDGSGYPHKISGNEIQISGQLILIADVYNALSSFRVHRDVYSPYEVSKIIEEETNSTFDNRVAKMFHRSFTPYEKGMRVFLNDGRTAVVKSIKTHALLPLIQCVEEETGENGEIIDLVSEKNIRIVQINI